MADRRLNLRRTVFQQTISKQPIFFVICYLPMLFS